MFTLFVPLPAFLWRFYFDDDPPPHPPTPPPPPPHVKNLNLGKQFKLIIMNFGFFFYISTTICLHQKCLGFHLCRIFLFPKRLKIILEALNVIIFTTLCYLYQAKLKK